MRCKYVQSKHKAGEKVNAKTKEHLNCAFQPIKSKQLLKIDPMLLSMTLTALQVALNDNDHQYKFAAMANVSYL